jgi:hypothetical protein
MGDKIRTTWLGTSNLSMNEIVTQADIAGYRMVGSLSYPLMFSKRAKNGRVRTVTVMADGRASGISWLPIKQIVHGSVGSGI